MLAPVHSRPADAQHSQVVSDPSIRSHPVRAGLALGSNLGDRAAAIRAALAMLDATPGLRVAAVSRLHDFDAATLPGQRGPQPRYLNAAARVDTTLDPRSLLSAMLTIERRLGRARAEPWGPRTIDLDLIFYGSARVNEPGLIVPHPRWQDRPFVRVPLAEVWPDTDLPPA
jgi:2-amino-4-hydroxy-6-hydroxymethyldihydropteridine diphosphokinase